MNCKNNTKYKQCMVKLEEIHEMLLLIIETGKDRGMSAIDLIEDCVQSLRIEDDHKQVQDMSEAELTSVMECGRALN